MNYKCDCGNSLFKIIIRDTYLISECKNCGNQKTWN